MISSMACAFFTPMRNLRPSAASESTLCSAEALPEESVPKITNINHAIDVIAGAPERGAEDVTVCLGGDAAGWSQFVESDRLRHQYNRFTLDRFHFAPDSLPSRRVVVKAVLRRGPPRRRRDLHH